MIIFIYGEDTYRSSQKLKEIKDKFIKEVDESGMNLSELDGASLKFEEFNQQVKSSAFLARKRMIIIKNLITDNKSKEIQKEIVKLLDNQDDQENLIVFWEETDHSKSRSKNALWDRLIKEKFAQEFKPLNVGQLNNWIKNEFNQKKAQIEPQAINLLGANIGNDLWQISNEINKLINFKQNETITVNDIEQQVKSKFDDDIFKLVDALGNKNKKLALKLISDQFNLGSKKLYLLTMLIRQFRILLQVKDLQNDNPSIPKDIISKELKLHPFVAQKAMAQAKNFTFDELKIIYKHLLNIDFQIKTGSAKPKLLFDLLIAKM